MRPFGPRILAKPFKLYIYSGVAMSLSNGIFPSPNPLISSSVPNISAPAYIICSCISLSAKTQTLISFPVPAGRTHVPLMF
jgi:hypothetical protein